MKNPNGFGTVTKMSGKRRKKWRAVKTIGWENGKQKRITIGYFESKAEGWEALGKYTYNPNAKLKLKDVYEMWSKVHYENLSPISIKNLKSRYNVYISGLGDRYISELTLQELQEHFSNFQASSGTLSLAKVLLNMIFNYAVKNNFITKNPVGYIELGKYKKVYEKKEFTKEEIDILWNNTGNIYTDSTLILIYTGMRIMELLRLKVKNIDLENRNIFVEDSKTDSGIRNIPIHEKIFPLIIKRITLNQEYLFVKDEKPYNYETYKRHFFKNLEDLGIQRHTPHECRHTTATLLSNAGANPISIAKIMGHTDYATMTAKVYTHKNSKELEKAIQALN